MIPTLTNSSLTDAISNQTCHYSKRSANQLHMRVDLDMPRLQNTSPFPRHEGRTGTHLRRDPLPAQQEPRNKREIYYRGNMLYTPYGVLYTNFQKARGVFDLIESQSSPGGTADTI